MLISNSVEVMQRMLDICSEESASWDSVFNSHYGLYIKLMKLSIPRGFIDILICWYGKCFGVVRYDNYLS